MLSKPIIGIVTRSFISTENHDISIIYKNIEKAIIKNGGMPIGITLNDNYKELIDICDGIIFQGGDDFEKYDLEALKYAYDINKSVLGICLGMQLMGILFDGEMIDINNHKKYLNYAHSIKIKRNSKLYNIFKTDIIKVNSRHKSVIKNTSLNITAISNDGYIEALEAINKNFFIGVQWHPESMIDYDNKQNNLFKNFIKSCD
ncbi:MAG: gamma-glutamyl-gamma-aminobutyrate hydrolase family protein [Bacilli bacterium]|nr:gamma-glutamyl-gamma-aminobutyrate hydrolase family protein [Bacilli bacterium]